MKVSQETEKRITEMLSEMTVEEKIGQMQQISYESYRPEVFERFRALGAGSFLHVLGEEADRIREQAKQTRMKIPPIFGIDAIHGHSLCNGAVIFPSQLAVACAWNPTLVEEMGRVAAREVNADGLDWVFSPVLCLGRDTRWGRVDETFGEDPYLAGTLGKAITKGYEEDGLVAACLKHYIGYGEATGGRDSYDTEVSIRKVRETFLPVFRRAVQAGASSVMTAYGSISGVPMTLHKELLRDILKEELGFEGFVVTDWYNIQSLRTNQKAVESFHDGVRLAVEAGNDMSMNTYRFYDSAIQQVKEGKLSMEVVDEAVRRILRVKFSLGLFDPDKKRLSRNVIGSAEHIAVNHKLTRESLVLLENDGILPLKTKPHRIAVIGPNADDIRAQYGDWTFFSHPDAAPEDCKPLSDYYTILRGVKTVFSDSEVVYAKGCHIMDETSDAMLEEAVALAESADIIIAVIGDCLKQNGEGRDRANLELSGRQNELMYLLKKTGKPVITVLVNGKPLCIGEAVKNSNAVIETFNGGDLGGLCAAELIAGNFNPSGKLPISFPRSSAQTPCYYNQYAGWHGGKYMDVEAGNLYDFGYGLSFTSFAYANPVISSDTANAGDVLTVSADVTNTGDTDGYETVQLYYNDRYSSVLTPEKQLCGFSKVWIKAGETVRVEIPLEVNGLALIDAQGKTVLEAGVFDIMIGGNLNSLQSMELTVESTSIL
ncbi:MAG: glycoside hydrolase family 3 C-terminal domain-containing protein [Clostridia bacterium]|nr:glycoside hydrolase family 3 C-terminal domain-containing protein [Clostridia bacterium]